MTDADVDSAPEVKSKQAWSMPQKVPNKRVCAFLVDMFSLVVIEAVLALILRETFWILDIAYLLIRDALFEGSSIGKSLVGLRVLNAAGKPCTLTQSILRNLIFLLPLTVVVEYIVMRSSYRERRLGDFVAKTRVIDLNPERPERLFLMISIALVIFFAVILGLYYKY